MNVRSLEIASSLCVMNWDMLLDVVLDFVGYVGRSATVYSHSVSLPFPFYRNNYFTFSICPK